MSYADHVGSLATMDEQTQHRLTFGRNPTWFNNPEREQVLTEGQMSVSTEGVSDAAAATPKPEVPLSKPQFFDEPTKPDLPPNLANLRMSRNSVFCGLFLLMINTMLIGCILYSLYQDSTYLKDTMRKEVERTDDLLATGQVMLHDFNDLWQTKFRPQSLETLALVTDSTTLFSQMVKEFGDKNATLITAQLLDTVVAFDQKLEALRSLLGGSAR